MEDKKTFTYTRHGGHPHAESVIIIIITAIIGVFAMCQSFTETTCFSAHNHYTNQNFYISGE